MRAEKEVIFLDALMRHKAKCRDVPKVSHALLVEYFLCWNHCFRAILSLLNPIGLHKAGAGNRCAQVLHSHPLGPWITFCSSLNVAGVPERDAMEAEFGAAPSVRQQHISPLLGQVRRPWRWKTKCLPRRQ